MSVNQDIIDNSTTLKQCLTELPKEEPRNLTFAEIDQPPDIVLFVAALVVLAVTLIDIALFVKTRRRLKYFFILIFVAFAALTTLWSEHIVEVVIQGITLARDTKWVSIAAQCYKKFELIRKWHFQPWMPLVTDIFRIVATGMESLVIFLGIVQDYCVKRRLNKKKLLISAIVIAVSGGLAACIMIRARTDVYGCSYNKEIDRYTCLVGGQVYAKKVLSADEVKQCDAKTRFQINNPAPISRLKLNQEDPGRNIPACTKNDGKALTLGGFSRHALLNQFFSEAAIIASVFLAILILSIIFEFYIIIKSIIFRQNIWFPFLMITLASIVLKDLYPLFSDIRKLHDRTESYRLITCGCMLLDFRDFKAELKESVWELVVLVFIFDVAVAFSKEIDGKGTHPDLEDGPQDVSSGEEHAAPGQDGPDTSTAHSTPAGDVHAEPMEANESNTPSVNPTQEQEQEYPTFYIEPPKNLRPRQLFKFAARFLKDARNGNLRPSHLVQSNI
ncbi:unnamed protein product [Agarophyton chilense]|eukprot:gb/GEZJ01000155.1/.p1 GENE.gb/GEZJ01000155.1/~~gb/GEZJ01000155.1/.p1  ORF type:complete len:502 (-),score=60.82 gb/GEZJ01000155.1/:6490-7995(-)